MPNYSNRNKLDALSEQAGELVGEINKLNRDTGQQIEGVDRKVRRSQRIMWLAMASLLADLIVTVVLAFNIHGTAQNTQQVDEITQRLDYSQNVTRKKVLCPLYQIFVDSKSEAGRKTYPKGPAEYDKVFAIIQESYDTIKCAEFKPEKG